MTVDTTTTSVERPGNGVAREFSFSPIKIFDETQLEVILRDADGVLTTLELGTGSSKYSVLATFVEGSSSTGSIRYPDSGGTLVPTGSTLSIRRKIPFKQEVNLENQGGYLPEVQESMHDQHVMRLQQLDEEIGRCVQVPFGSDVPAEDYISTVEAAAAAAAASASTASGAASTATTAKNAAQSAQAAAEAARDEAQAIVEGPASLVSYDHTTSGLTASDVQAAIDEVSDSANIKYDPSTSGLTATKVKTAVDELAARGGWSNSGYRTNYYNRGLIANYSAASMGTMSGNTLYARPFVVGKKETFTRIGCHVNVAETGKSVRLGIYLLENGLPTTLVLDAGTVSLTSTGEAEITISKELSPGNYMVAALSNSTGTALLRIASINPPLVEYFLGAESGTASTTHAVSASQTYGALPNSFPGSPTSLNYLYAIDVWLRKV